jgi:hypothetical protein
MPPSSDQAAEMIGRTNLDLISDLGLGSSGFDLKGNLEPKSEIDSASSSVGWLNATTAAVHAWT